jgi:hypothetical protein
LRILGGVGNTRPQYPKVQFSVTNPRLVDKTSLENKPWDELPSSKDHE